MGNIPETLSRQGLGGPEAVGRPGAATELWSRQFFIGVKQ
jgi:hypothetical protein